MTYARTSLGLRTCSRVTTCRVLFTYSGRGGHGVAATGEIGQERQGIRYSERASYVRPCVDSKISVFLYRIDIPRHEGWRKYTHRALLLGD